MNFGNARHSIFTPSRLIQQDTVPPTGLNLDNKRKAWKKEYLKTHPIHEVKVTISGNTTTHEEMFYNESDEYQKLEKKSKQKQFNAQHYF